jgi:hypothetical protein
MNTAQAVVELHKIQKKIDKLVKRIKELDIEKNLYTAKFNNGKIGPVLYGMRMTPIYFEKGVVMAEYKTELKCFNDMETIYAIAKSFEGAEAEEEI